MNIRQANEGDFENICAVFEFAKRYMRENGNLKQWADGYPYPETIHKDISEGICYVCEDNEEIIGVFTLFDGPDPYYGKIMGKQWLNDNPYGVVHRIAVLRNRGGVASECFSFCEEKYTDLRIDTHEDNTPMRNFLTKRGFVQCGTVFIENGEERIAFHKTVN